MSDPKHAAKSDLHSRTILPIPDRQHIGLVTYDAKDPETKFLPIEPLRPPEGAPNVLVILLDDVGFGASSAFGGPCETPNFEMLASGGPGTIASTPPRSAHPLGRHCLQVAIIIRLGWAASPKSPLLRPAIVPFCPRTKHRCR